MRGRETWWEGWGRGRASWRRRRRRGRRRGPARPARTLTPPPPSSPPAVRPTQGLHPRAHRRREWGGQASSSELARRRRWGACGVRRRDAAKASEWAGVQKQNKNVDPKKASGYARKLILCAEISCVPCIISTSKLFDDYGRLDPVGKNGRWCQHDVSTTYACKTILN